MSRFQIVRPQTAFSRDKPRRKAGGRKRTTHDEHLAWIRRLPSMITGRRGGVEAAHVSMADPSVGKTSRGKGQKADDMFVVPLSGALHRKQHSMSEREFWDGYGIDPVKVALALYAVSGNDEEGERIIMETVR